LTGIWISGTLQGFILQGPVSRNGTVATFNIPTDDQEGFALLKDISDDTFNQLLLKIENDDESNSVTGLSSAQTAHIINAIYSASAVRVSADVALDEFINDLCASLPEGFFGPDQDEARFRERLTRVLSIESVIVVAKAFALHSEHERQFCSARIFTDARPVYADDPAAPPSAMVITHTLKINFHGEGGRLHEIYLGIGSKGISDLMKVLERAKDKAKSLKETVETKKLQFLDPQL
jgi:hypothetical protein